MSVHTFLLSTLRKSLAFFALLLVFASSISGVAQAATADVTHFNAVLVTTPTTMHKLWYKYNGSWSGANRRGARSTDWFQNNVLHTPISTASHTTSPFDVTVTEYTIPRSSGSGNYYTVVAWVMDTLDPSIVYASDSMQDGDFTN